MDQPKLAHLLLTTVFLSPRLAVNVVLGLQTLYVFLQVGPVGIIRHARESGLQSP